MQLQSGKRDVVDVVGAREKVSIAELEVELSAGAAAAMKGTPKQPTSTTINQSTNQPTNPAIQQTSGPTKPSQASNHLVHTEGTHSLPRCRCHPLTHSRTHAPTRTHPHTLTHSLAHSLTLSLSYSLTRLTLTHSLPHSLTLTHSLTHPLNLSLTLVPTAHSHQYFSPTNAPGARCRRRLLGRPTGARRGPGAPTRTAVHRVPRTSRR